jgi:hypothetical protein
VWRRAEQAAKDAPCAANLLQPLAGMLQQGAHWARLEGRGRTSRPARVDDVLIEEASVDSWPARLARLGGVAAFLGGLAWTLKGVVILAGGDQPPLLFEAAPTLFGLGLMSVAYSTLPPGRRRGAVLGLSATAALSGLAALVSDIVGEVADLALVISSVTLLIGLLMIGRNRRWPARLAWYVGLAMVPAVIVGGMLSEIDERLLEVPLVCLGAGWMTVGWATALRRRVTVDA